jgi:hypothetical protein
MGLVKPEEGKLLGLVGAGVVDSAGATGLPGGMSGGSRSLIVESFSLGKSIGACLNWVSVFCNKSRRLLVISAV